MTCVAYGAPLPKITWTRNDSIDIDPSAITERNLTVNGTVFSVSILEFCAVNMSHIAWYNCTATNGVSGSGIAESTAQFYLHILEAATGMNHTYRSQKSLSVHAHSHMWQNFVFMVHINNMILLWTCL